MKRPHKTEAHAAFLWILDNTDYTGVNQSDIHAEMAGAWIIYHPNFEKAKPVPYRTDGEVIDLAKSLGRGK